MGGTSFLATSGGTGYKAGTISKTEGSDTIHLIRFVPIYEPLLLKNVGTVTNAGTSVQFSIPSTLVPVLFVSTSFSKTLTSSSMWLHYYLSYDGSHCGYRAEYIANPKAYDDPLDTSRYLGGSFAIELKGATFVKFVSETSLSGSGDVLIRVGIPLTDGLDLSNEGYVFGGQDINNDRQTTNKKYVPDTWTNSVSLPAAVCCGAAGGVFNWILMSGGYRNSILKEVKRFNLHTWIASQPLSWETRYHSSTSFRGAVLIVYKDTESSYHNEVKTYMIDSWTSRVSFSLIHNDYPTMDSTSSKVIIVGGSGSSSYYHCSNYNPDTSSIEALTDNPDGAWSHGGSTIDEKIYRYYGGSASTSFTNLTSEYNPSTNSWTAKTNGLTPTRRTLAAFSISNKGYVFGGYDSSNDAINNVAEFYNNSWTAKTSLWKELKNLMGTSI